MKHESAAVYYATSLLTHCNEISFEMGNSSLQILHIRLDIEGVHVYFKGTPEPEIKWYKGDAKIKPSKKDKRVRLDYDVANDLSVLEIHSASVNDAGEYIVKASNENGSAKATVEVQVRPKQTLRQESVESFEEEELNSKEAIVNETVENGTDDKLESKAVTTYQEEPVQEVKSVKENESKLEDSSEELLKSLPKVTAQQPVLPEKCDFEIASVEDAENTEKVPLTKDNAEPKAKLPELNERTLSELYEEDKVKKVVVMEETTMKKKKSKNGKEIKDEETVQTDVTETIENVHEDVKEMKQLLVENEKKIEIMEEQNKIVKLEEHSRPKEQQAAESSNLTEKVEELHGIENKNITSTEVTESNEKVEVTEKVILEEVCLAKNLRLVAKVEDIDEKTQNAEPKSDVVLAPPEEDLSVTKKGHKTKNKPVMLIKPEPVAVEEGNTIVLTCRATG